MYKIENVLNHSDVKTIGNSGSFKIIEYKDFVTGNVVRQVICDINNSPVVIEPSRYLWEVGEMVISKNSGAFTELFKKTTETETKPEYNGQGYLMLKPTEKYVTVVKMSDWQEQLTIDEAVFMAGEAGLKMKCSSKSGLSSVTTAKGNTMAFSGKGHVCIELPYKEEDLVKITIEKDVFKLEHGRAIMWSSALTYAVENNPGGMIDVFRGSGKILF